MVQLLIILLLLLDNIYSATPGSTLVRLVDNRRTNYNLRMHIHILITLQQMKTHPITT